MSNTEKTVIIDEELIASGQSGNGGWNKKQLEILGVAWPPPKGWKKEVIGNTLTCEQAGLFVKIKGTGTPNKDAIKKEQKKSPPIFIKTEKKLSWEEQYQHPNWQKLRLIILNRDKFTCVRCGDNQSQLHVHHLRYDKNKNIWGVRHADLITLCDKCHTKEHKKPKFF